MKKRWSILFALLCAALLCAACGEKKPDEPVDRSGRYTDKQGTDQVYSELELSRNDGGGYTVTLGIYRVTTLEGTAAEEDGVLHFAASSGPAVEGDIVVSGETAEVTITASDFSDMPVGSIYQFLDGE